MQIFEVGVLPQSKFFFFSPTEKAKKLFYHQTMCGHFFCTDEYYIKRDSFPPLLLTYVVSGNMNLELGDKTYSAGAGQVLFSTARTPITITRTAISNFTMCTSTARWRTRSAPTLTRPTVY